MFDIISSYLKGSVFHLMIASIIYQNMVKSLLLVILGGFSTFIEHRAELKVLGCANLPLMSKGGRFHPT